MATDYTRPPQYLSPEYIPKPHIPREPHYEPFTTSPKKVLEIAQDNLILSYYNCEITVKDDMIMYDRTYAVVTWREKDAI